MDSLEKAKIIIKENIHHAKCGIYNCRNLAGDHMTTIYEDDEIQIDICYYWEYFEVFGLDFCEFSELEKYYKSLRERIFTLP